MCEGLPGSYHLNYYEYKAREQRALRHHAEFDYIKRAARAKRRRRFIGNLARFPRRLWVLGEATVCAFAGFFRAEAKGEVGG